MRLGDHVCLSFANDLEWESVLGRFLAAGRARNEKALVFAAGNAADIRDHLVATHGNRLDEVTVENVQDVYLQGRTFSPDGMLEQLGVLQQQALDEGFAGIRIGADMRWTAREVAPADLFDYEQEANRIFADRKMVAICAYDRRHFDSNLLSRAHATHPLLLESEAEQDLHATPLVAADLDGGSVVALGGELDFSNAALLADFLTTRAEATEELRVDVAQLDFIDASAARILVRAALRNPGTTIRLEECRPHIERVLRLVGSPLPPNLEVPS